MLGNERGIDALSVDLKVLFASSVEVPEPFITYKKIQYLGNFNIYKLVIFTIYHLNIAGSRIGSKNHKDFIMDPFL